MRKMISGRTISQRRRSSQIGIRIMCCLVEKTMEGVVQRVGLGKVFKEAFQNPCLPGLEWKEIILE